MVSYGKIPSINAVQKKPSHSASILDNIQKEYCLKRNNFDPQGPSPNIFMTKLELRMQAYFNSFCSSKNYVMK